MIKLTDKIISEFFPRDNRFLHFVAKKHGQFFMNEDDVERASFYALEYILKKRGEEFENMSHINSLAEWAFRGAISRMISYNQAQKRDVEVYSESDFYADHDDARSVMDNLFEMQPELDTLMTDAKQCLEDKDYDIIKMTILGYNMVEIGEKYNQSAESIRQRKIKVIKQLRVYYEIDKRTNRVNGESLRKRIQRKSSKKAKVQRSRAESAIDYLYSKEKVFAE